VASDQRAFVLPAFMALHEQRLRIDKNAQCPGQKILQVIGS